MAPPDRRPYRRETEEARRDALISAALELVAEGGAKAATVRAIAQRAGVTPGLIRHYFASKDELTRAAYSALMSRMTKKSVDALDVAQASPLYRLGLFMSVSLRPPVMDPAGVGLWAGFLHGMRSDDAMRAVHKQNYYEYRDLLQSLIAALPRDLGPRDVSAARLRADAIACNGVIDGLWLEGSVLPEGFAPGELERIGLEAVGAILGVDLAGAMALSATPENETTKDGETI